MQHRTIYWNRIGTCWVWECKVCPGRPRQGGFASKRTAEQHFVREHESTPMHRAHDPGVARSSG